MLKPGEEKVTVSIHHELGLRELCSRDCTFLEIDGYYCKLFHEDLITQETTGIPEVYRCSKCLQEGGE